MTINECINEFKIYVSSYCASDTLDYYNINLRMFTQYLVCLKGSLDIDINEIHKIDYVGYIAYCKKKNIKNVSVRTYARAIKVFLRYCFNEGYLLENITLNVKFPKSDKRLVMPLNVDEVDDLLCSIRSSPLFLRNWCIFELMLDCGLRRSEIINLNVDDIDFNNCIIHICESKNNKSRLVPIPVEVKNDVIRYRDECKTVYKYNGCQALILNRNYTDRITEHGIDMLFYRLKKVVPRVYPHLLRHTFATSFILGGGSLETLRVLMGHSDYNVTKEYLHVAAQMRLTDFDIYKLDEVFFKIYNYNK